MIRICCAICIRIQLNHRVFILSGTVEHQEWNTTVDFFLELNEEEAAMRDHHAKGSLVDVQKKLRANKMKELQVAALSVKAPKGKTMDDGDSPV